MQRQLITGSIFSAHQHLTASAWSAPWIINHQSSIINHRFVWCAGLVGCVQTASCCARAAAKTLALITGIVNRRRAQSARVSAFVRGSSAESLQRVVAWMPPPSSITVLTRSVQGRYTVPGRHRLSQRVDLEKKFRKRYFNTMNIYVHYDNLNLTPTPDSSSSLLKALCV